MNTSYPDDDDGDVLRAMAESGVDMAEPVTIEFVIDAPSEEKAKAIEAALAAGGHPASADFEDGDPEEGIDPGWIVSVELEMVPDYQALITLQAELERVAKGHDGQVDGWGAIV